MRTVCPSLTKLTTEEKVEGGRERKATNQVAFDELQGRMGWSNHSGISES